MVKIELKANDDDSHSRNTKTIVSVGLWLCNQTYFLFQFLPFFSLS